MRKVKIKNIDVLIYDSIDEMPIINFSRYNKYLLIDSGIGSNLSDFDVHIERLAKLIMTDKDLAIQELMNMRQQLYFISNGINPSHLAFASLIAKVNGEPIENTSDDVIIDLLHKLGHVKETDVQMLLADIKKKVELELNTFFPEMESSEQKEAYNKLKERTQYVLEDILNDNINNTEKVNDIDTYFLLLSKPKSFAGTKSVEVKYIKEFEKACILISQETNLNPKSLTVLQFYISLDQIRKRNNQQFNIKRNGRR